MAWHGTANNLVSYGFSLRSRIHSHTSTTQAVNIASVYMCAWNDPQCFFLFVRSFSVLVSVLLLLLLLIHSHICLSWLVSIVVCLCISLYILYSCSALVFFVVVDVAVVFILLKISFFFFGSGDFCVFAHSYIQYAYAHTQFNKQHTIERKTDLMLFSPMKSHFILKEKVLVNGNWNASLQNCFFFFKYRKPHLIMPFEFVFEVIFFFTLLSFFFSIVIFLWFFSTYHDILFVCVMNFWFLGWMIPRKSTIEWSGCF